MWGAGVKEDFLLFSFSNWADAGGVIFILIMLKWLEFYFGQVKFEMVFGSLYKRRVLEFREEVGVGDEKVRSCYYIDDI